MTTIGSPLMWTGFLGLVLALLALDLGVFHRKAHKVGFKEALGWSVVWVALALAFNAWIWSAFGRTAGVEFLTGYLIEKALAVDNIFVFAMLFAAFAVPSELQHRVLFWGIVGALVMRAAFIFAGAALLDQFHWLIYVFGALLIATGVKMLVLGGGVMDPRDNPVYRWFARVVPSTSEYRGQSFWVREGARWVATPLLLVLVCIELTDLIFAVDSIPAIFAVTRDPFIVFTSNIFAILGLRAMYFLLADFMHRFEYLKVGLALVLVFVGGKMALSGFWKMPTEWSLVVVALLIGTSVAVSWWKSSGREHAAVSTEAG